MQKKTIHLVTIIQSGLLWAGIPVLWSFMPAYYEGVQFSASQIGLLMAINPIVAIIMQPFVGVHVDRARSKNMFYVYLMGGTVLSAILLPISTAFYFVLIMMIVLSLFQCTLIPISESISLETLEHLNYSYAPVRMFGTILYSFSALLFGVSIKYDQRSIFYLAALMAVLNMLAIWKMPHVKGHQSKGNKVSVKEVFKDRMLLLYVLLAVVAMMLMSFFYTFMPVYYLQLGGNRDRMGWLFFIAAMSEVPFLVFADRIIDKLGNKITLSISTFVIGLRVFLLLFVNDPNWLYPISVLNGLAFIVFNYTLAVYINRTVRKELKTTGQAVLAVSMGVGKAMGAFAGGILIDGIGLNNTVGLSFGICLVSIILFLILSKRIQVRMVAQ